MTRKSEVEFANLTLQFGQDYFLLDLFNEIVYPAFFDESLERSYGDNSCVFRDVKLINIGTSEEPRVLLIGRHIKNMFERREQYLNENNKIVKDELAIPSSPSAIFIIFLNTHRMMLYGESKKSPSLKAFKTTLKKFIKIKVEEHIQKIYEDENNQFTKRQLQELFFPILNIVALTNDEAIEEFINRYDILKEVNITLINPNQEIDNDDFFEQVREKSREVQSPSTSLKYRNSTQGLSLSNIGKQISSALRHGNSKLKLKGKDSDGNELIGSQEEMQIKHNFSTTEVSFTLDAVVNRCVQLFDDFVNSGKINIPDRELSIVEKIINIWRNNNDGG